MSRRALFSTLVLLPAFFLIVMGTRTPSLAHSQGPRPRPRAIIVENIKAADVQGDHQQVDAEAPPPAPFETSSEEVRLLFTAETEHLPAPAPTYLDSRGPPPLPHA